MYNIVPNSTIVRDLAIRLQEQEAASPDTIHKLLDIADVLTKEEKPLKPEPDMTVDHNIKPDVEGAKKCLNKIVATEDMDYDIIIWFVEQALKSLEKG